MPDHQEIHKPRRQFNGLGLWIRKYEGKLDYSGTSITLYLLDDLLV